MNRILVAGEVGSYCPGEQGLGWLRHSYRPLCFSLQRLFFFRVQLLSLSSFSFEIQAVWTRKTGFGEQLGLGFGPAVSLLSFFGLGPPDQSPGCAPDLGLLPLFRMFWNTASGVSSLNGGTPVRNSNRHTPSAHQSTDASDKTHKRNVLG